ncbi:MAG TPA: PEP-CTERM-box response regulator transcription factor [candidate division Zixibacteria bacterium]|nr:PEP-CTERM-box response regulator transcription factor [candidate division Zixibacteria bacterium]
MKRKLLLVDDEEALLQQLRWALGSEYDVLTASREREAEEIFDSERPAVTVLDLALNPGDPADLGGLRLLEKFLTREPSTSAIVVTGNSAHSNALRAMRLGAFDYFSKPVRLEELKVMIARAFYIHDLRRRLEEQPAPPAAEFQGIIGGSRAMREVFRAIERVAASDLSVLISGESGTGKELVAHAIHRRSRRNEEAFVVVNCAAIPDNLLESDLFGHEKGAFTGAYAQKRGKFELAHRGTLFLDEIGELAAPLQVKLLRFLQNRRIERVGGTQSIELDVRIIAATNRDLQKEMEGRRFREDLYYRLRVVPIHLPPLRERPEDIVPLAEHFLAGFCREQRKAPMTLSREAIRALSSYGWPGNVRELENVISRAVVLAGHSIIREDDLGFTPEPPASINLKYARRAMEIEFVRKALFRNRGIVSRAARDLGISRVNLYELMARYKIRNERWKRTDDRRPKTGTSAGTIGNSELRMANPGSRFEVRSSK